MDGLVIDRQARPHPRTRDIYTLGECVTEAYPSDFGGPDTVRSAVVLYYGSFLRLSRLDPAFDWSEEIWETLTHELRHHLEWVHEIRKGIGGHGPVAPFSDRVDGAVPADRRPELRLKTF